ncbi:MAG: MFS transporter [Alphaproteobacteria bacterium]|nr:MFS transporter [Alphaproteobacteria bacterium]
MASEPQDTPQRDHSQSVRILTLISTGHALSNFYVLCIPALIPFLKLEFGVSYALLGALLTVRAITTGLLQIPMGFMVDQLGGKRVLIAGLYMLSLSFLLFAFIPSFWWAMPLMMLFGVGLATMRPSNYTILNASISPSWIGRAFGINMFAAHSGRAIAPPLIVTIAIFWDWRVAMFIAGVMGIIVATTLASQWRIVRDDIVQPKKSHDLSFVQEIRSLASGSLFLFFIFFIFNALTTHGVHSFTVAALAELRGTPVTVASGALTGYLIASALGVLAGGFLVDWTPRHALLAVAVILGSGAVFVLIGSADMSIVLIIVAMSFAGFLQGVLRPARDMMLRAVIPAESFGKAIGMVATGAAIGGAAAPIVFGWILDTGHASWLFYVLAACLVILIITILIPKTRITLS